MRPIIEMVRRGRGKALRAGYAHERNTDRHRRPSGGGARSLRRKFLWMSATSPSKAPDPHVLRRPAASPRVATPQPVRNRWRPPRWPRLRPGSNAYSESALPVIVKLAERKMPLSNIVGLAAGAILEFDKPSDSPLDLMINNKSIGLGQAVKVGENFRPPRDAHRLGTEPHRSPVRSLI